MCSITESVLEPELVSRPGAASEGSRGGSGPADADTEAVGGVT